MGKPQLPDGLVAIVKQDCETCRMVVPMLGQLRAAAALTVYTQDNPDFPEDPVAIHDDDLAVSWHHEIETVPTLIRVIDGEEVERTVGWLRSDWEALSGVTGLGPDLPPMRPGCGSKSVDPDLVDELRVRHGGSVLRSRRIEVADAEDHSGDIRWNFEKFLVGRDGKIVARFSPMVLPDAPEVVAAIESAL